MKAQNNTAKNASNANAKKAPAANAGRKIDAFGYGAETGAAKIMAQLSAKKPVSVQAIAEAVNTPASRVRAHFAHAMNATLNGVRRDYVKREGRNAYVLTGRTLADVLGTPKKAPAAKKGKKAPAEAAPASA